MRRNQTGERFQRHSDVNNFYTRAMMWYWPPCECVCACCGRKEIQIVQVWTLVSQDRAEAAAHVGFLSGIKLWVGSGNGENDQPVYVLWLSGHCCVDSHFGLVFGKGLLGEMSWE